MDSSSDRLSGGGSVGLRDHSGSMEDNTDDGSHSDRSISISTESSSSYHTVNHSHSLF